MAGLFASQALRWVTSRSSSADSEDGSEHGDRGAVPFIASPVDPKAYAWLRRRRKTDNVEHVPGKVRRSYTVAQFESEHTDSKLANRIFRKQHAASTLELFFDLFFVANLAVFTDNHEHVTGETIANYIGFFSILWSTWFHISLHDVRFYTDCTVNRIIKLMCFGVMTAFVALGAIYDNIMTNGTSRAFQGIALVLMGIRFVWCLQYGIVLYFVAGFKKTILPLGLMMLIYFATAIGFMVTFLADKGVVLDGIEGSAHVTRWYIIICVEAVAVITISSIWRVLSFKHTHLVERIGLLTLIVMGEGILGLLKRVSYVLDGTNVSIWAETGLVASAVALIYAVYLLYFDNVDHDRFGSIRQQIWTLLHFLLHVAILLTVEGQTALTTWDAVHRAIMWFEERFPDPADPASGYDSTTAIVTAVNNTVSETALRYHYAPLSDYYDPTPDLAALQNTTAEFATSEWNETVSETLNTIKYNVEYFLFMNFQAEGPAEELEATKDPEEKVQILNDSFGFVFEYFFIGAGALLIMMAVLFWFGKTRKRIDEWVSIAVRVLVGAGLACVSAVAFTEKEGDTTSFRFNSCSWIIPIVTFSFLAILTADNLIQVLFGIKKKDKKRHSSEPSLAGTQDEESSYDSASRTQSNDMNMRQVSFKKHDDRKLSQGSDTGWEGVDATSPVHGNNKGYSSLGQNDDEADSTPRVHDFGARETR